MRNVKMTNEIETIKQMIEDVGELQRKKIK